MHLNFKTCNKFPLFVDLQLVHPSAEYVILAIEAKIQGRVLVDIWQYSYKPITLNQLRPGLLPL